MRSVTLSILFAAATACAGTSSDLVIHDSPRGSVTLERASAVQAAHPITLDPAVISATLRGLHLTAESGFGRIFASDPAVVPVFSEDEIRFLTPLIAEALRTARSDQFVRFSTVRSGALNTTNERVGAAAGSSDSVIASRNERTGGMLYAYGLSLYVTLTEYRHRDERPDAINMPNRRIPDPTGYGERKVLFFPESVLRSDSYKPKAGWLGSDGLTTLVIDYQKLSHAEPIASRPPSPSEQKPAAAAAPSSPSKPAEAQPDDVQAMKDLVIKKDLEVEALKKELQTLKKRLGESERSR